MSDSPQRPWVTLRSAQLSAQIDPLGAQLSILQDAEGRNLLWDGDPAVWSGRAPLLFPIVGALAGGTYRLGGRSFALPRHGFARVSRFELDENTDERARFVLRASDVTWQIYPFRFELWVSFRLSGATLILQARVCNAGEVPMPASLGFHPAFRWPLPYGGSRSSHGIEFLGGVPGKVRRLDSLGLLTEQLHSIALAGRRLQLADSQFVEDALIFDDCTCERLRYGAPGLPQLEVSLAHAPFLGIWTKPGAGFICIEPWHGIADPVGYVGEFRDKPGVFTVEPGAERCFEMSISLVDPA